MIFAVIDTNVFVSAFLTHNPLSATFRVVEALLQGKITILYNEEIMNEYKDVLSRQRFGISVQERELLFDYIREYGVSASRIKSEEVFVDEDDRVFYEISLSQADAYLVTGNLKHFPYSLSVISPAQLLALL